MAIKPPQILQLTPTSEIIFEGPFDRVVTSYLELKNPSEQRVCFKVKTTAPRRYCVRPNSGIVEPGNKLKIAIMLQPIEQDSQSERNKHKFMVQSTIIRESDISFNIDSVWQNAPQDTIMDSKLRCIFQVPNSTGFATDAATISSTTTASLTTKPTTTATNSTTATSTTTTTTTTQQEQQNASSSQKSGSGDGQSTSTRSKDSGPFTTSSTSNAYKAVSSNVSNQILKKTNVLDGDKSIASSHNLTASFLQPMSDDYKIVLVSLAMLLIGVILGKYII